MTLKLTRGLMETMSEIPHWLNILVLFKHQLKTMCSSRKYPYSPHRRDWNSREGGGSQRPKHLKQCMRLNWNFQRGGGSEGGGGYRYFLELHNFGKESELFHDFFMTQTKFSNFHAFSHDLSMTV